ncbi:hypothetical protein CLV99_2221 [Sphingobacterium yanglingense]|uniref:Uncharacterized protein n=1 Tax=Sphingobacterium yanglingense TaxID=1437280 RepID=A0A4R6WIR1_9SPHI|nr:hypothetical protein CLV99_2221 [Sphingobacterium yanglingense]
MKVLRAYIQHMRTVIPKKAVSASEMDDGANFFDYSFVINLRKENTPVRQVANSACITNSTFPTGRI